MLLSRRNMLAASAGAAALAACGKTADTSKSASGATGNSISKVGIQTYTLREAMGKDFLGTLKMIKDVGYDYVELNERNYAERTPQQLKDALDEVGLPCPASHMGIDTIRRNFAGGMSAAKQLGLEYVFVPYIAENERSLEDWKAHASLLNGAGEVMRNEGVKLGYHNHQFEFEDLGGGTTAMQVLMENTDPENVCFELDLYWTVLAQLKPTDVIAKYPGRFRACHIKDMTGGAAAAAAAGASYDELTRDYMVDVGQGEIDFEPIFAMNDVSGMEYFIAEHDFPKAPYRNAIQNSLDAIRAMRF